MIAEMEAAPPCRVLFRDGAPVDELITEREHRPQTYKRTDVMSVYDAPFIPPASRTVRTVDSKPSRVAKPKTERKPRANGRGRGWNRKEFSTEQVIELRQQGKSYREIGDILGCSWWCAQDRIREYRKSHPAHHDGELRICPDCGGPKMLTSMICGWCAKKTPERMAAKNAKRRQDRAERAREAMEVKNEL